MSADRGYNPAAFITTTLADAIRCREDRPGLTLGIDEGMNNETHIGSLCRRLIAAGVVFASVPLWYQQRENAQGQRFMAVGSSVSPSPLMTDVGRAVRGSSWPDERVVALLVAEFLSTDRLCLFTQNTKNDVNGLRWILEREVGPALENLSPRRLGLLVLSPVAGTSLANYTEAVEHRLRSDKVLPGFHWENLPG